MKPCNQTLALLLSIATLGSVANAQNQYAFNRAITGVEVRPAQGQPAGVFELKVGVEVNLGDTLQVPAGGLDLSAEVQLYIDGNLRSVVPLTVMATVANGGVDCEACPQTPCGQINGFNAFCSGPPFSAPGDCYCTSDVWLDPFEELLVPGNVVTVTIVAVNNQIAELYTPDDTSSFPFLGSNYCGANANSTGHPAQISAAGSVSVQANNLLLSASPTPPNQFGIFFYGSAAIEMPFGDGYRCVGGQTYRLPVTNGGSEGVLRTQLDLSNPPEPSGQITAGSTHHFQAWYRDPTGGPVGYNLSDGYMITFLP